MLEMQAVAWLVLRIGFAWLYLYSLKSLLADWNATEDLVGLLFPYFRNLLAAAMVFVMFVGAILIAFGIYAEIAAIFLFVYNLIGVVIHLRLAKLVKSSQLSPSASSNDKKILADTQQLGIVGHVTSAQKNIVLAAVAFFFIFAGSGPWSITASLWS